MNSMVKTFSLLSLSAAAGKKIKEGGKSEKHIYSGEKLQEVSLLASSEYDANINKDLLLKAFLKVKSVVGDSNNGVLKTPIDELLSFLNCGLIDLWVNGNPKYRGNLDKIIERMVSAHKLYDPQLNNLNAHNKGFDLYEKWVST